MMSQEIDFEDWYIQVKKIAVEQFKYSKSAIQFFDESNFREYYKEGYSPFEAMKDDNFN